MKKDLLFEIGCHRLPPSKIRQTVLDLSRAFEQKASEAGIEHGEIRLFATQRRLAIIVKDVDTTLVESDTVLSSLLSSLALEVNWGSFAPIWRGKNPHIKPIKWLLALFGEDVVKCQVYHVKGGRKTKGNCLLSYDNLEIGNPDEYEKILTENKVIPDFIKRKESILTQINDICQNLGRFSGRDEDLLEELTFQIEWPVAYSGAFSSRFANLPKCVLRRVLRYRSSIALHDDLGLNVPQYISFVSVPISKDGYNQPGQDHYLVNCLQEAENLLESGKGKTLEQRRELLSDLPYLHGLGTVLDKVKRIEMVSSYLSEYLNFSEEEKESVARCASLCKSDWSSKILEKYPDLEGILGQEYAKADGESDIISQSIFDQYCPRELGERSAQYPVGAVISLAEKSTTLVESFMLGREVSGDSDPHALRSLSSAILTTLTDFQYSIPIQDLISEAIEAYELSLEDPPKKSSEKIIVEFIKTELENHLSIYPKDIVSCVLKTDENLSDILWIFTRIEGIIRMHSWGEIPRVQDSLKRIDRILEGKDYPTDRFCPDLFQIAMENELVQITGNELFDILVSLGSKGNRLFSHLTCSRLPVVLKSTVAMMEIKNLNPIIRDSIISLLHMARETLDSLGDLRTISAEEVRMGTIHPGQYL